MTRDRLLRDSSRSEDGPRLIDELRAGRVSRELVQLVAFCGDPVARDHAPASTVEYSLWDEWPLHAWLPALETLARAVAPLVPDLWGPPLVTAEQWVGAAAAESVGRACLATGFRGEVYCATSQFGDYQPIARALDAAAAWLREPTETNKDAWGRATWNAHRPLPNWVVLPGRSSGIVALLGAVQVLGEHKVRELVCGRVLEVWPALL